MDIALVAALAFTADAARAAAAPPIAVGAPAAEAVPTDAASPQQRGFGIGANAASAYRPRLHTAGVLDDRALEDAVRSGLPLRLRFRVELWRDRFFDELVGSESWTTVVFFDPLDETFALRLRGGATPIRVDSYAAMREAVERAYTLTLRPRRTGKHYYTAVLEIETLSLSDLEELENWLHGELRPAVRGEGSVPSAVGEGVKRLFIRVLGLPARRHEARSDVFRVSESQR